MTSKGKIGEIKEIRRSAQELCLEWHTLDILSLSSKGNDFFESCQFFFRWENWNLRIWPNSASSVWLSLTRNNSKGSDINVNIALSIKGSHGMEKRIEEKLVYSNNMYGPVKRFCSRSELNEQKQRLMPTDVLIIVCEMKTAVTDATIEADADLKESLTNGKQSPGKKGVEELIKSLHGLLAGGEDSDVRISVGDKEFPAHRAILRARSPVFNAMFAHDMVEKQSGVVTMEDCDPEAFPDFLEHVYTGSVEMISVGNVSDLYRMSDKYDLNALKTECTQFLKRNLTVASFCNTITLAIRHSDKDLTAQATEFFCDNSLEIVETAEWQTFLHENSTVGNELFIKSLRRNQNK